MGLGIQQSFLKEVMMSEARLEGRARVSSNCRGRMTRTSPLTGCGSQRRESRRFKESEISRRNNPHSESVHHASTESRKRCIFSPQRLKGKVFDFIQNPLVIFDLCKLNRKIRGKHCNSSFSENPTPLLPALHHAAIP